MGIKESWRYVAIKIIFYLVSSILYLQFVSSVSSRVESSASLLHTLAAGRRFALDYGVYFGKEQVGKVQVQRQGLYYRFTCRCRISGDVMCRLWVSSGDKRENLGLVVPMDGGFGLNTSLPVKRLGEGELTFTLLPKHDAPTGKFVPISPEEPFAYIERLKEAYLVRKGEQVGIELPE